MFDAHPPFQIDGNFAGAAGLMEMLLQSQGGEIFLLPALPDVWKDGAVKGLVARGNYIVNINWVNGKLSTAELLSKNGGDCIIRTNQPISIQGVNKMAKKSGIGYVLSFKSVKGNLYKIISK
jgi:alpha-L-fucosidase 2